MCTVNPIIFGCPLFLHVGSIKRAPLILLFSLAKLILIIILTLFVTHYLSWRCQGHKVYFMQSSGFAIYLSVL